jgi:hypothetical protein
MASIRKRHLDLNTLHDKPVVQKEKYSPKPQNRLRKSRGNGLPSLTKQLPLEMLPPSLPYFKKTVYLFKWLPTLGWWRDVLGMSWDFHTYQTPTSIEEMIMNTTTEIGLTNFHLDTEKEVFLGTPSPEFGDCIVAYFLFETRVGRGRGIFRLTPADSSGHEWNAFTLYTSL